MFNDMAMTQFPTLSSLMAEMIADMKRICREQKTPTTWQQKFCYAEPYIQALRTLDNPTDYYGCEQGKFLINYLLANLSQYRGEKAKEIKKILKEMAK